MRSALPLGGLVLVVREGTRQVLDGGAHCERQARPLPILGGGITTIPHLKH